MRHTPAMQKCPFSWDKIGHVTLAWRAGANVTVEKVGGKHPGKDAWMKEIYSDVQRERSVSY